MMNRQNRKLCLRCAREHEMQNVGGQLKRHWRDGIIYGCPFGNKDDWNKYRWVKFADKLNLPEECPYLFEHIVIGQGVIDEVS